MRRLCYAVLLIGLTPLALPAGLIQTVNFFDGNWDFSLSESDGAVNDSKVSVTFPPLATRITAEKASGSGGVRISAFLTGSISTAGYDNIRLSFVTTSSGLEWNGDLTSAVSASDGLLVTGSGISVVNDGPRDLIFDSSVADGEITDLSFTLQVNALNEFLSLSRIEIFGETLGSTAVVPEPTSLAFLACGVCPLMLRRRRT